MTTGTTPTGIRVRDMTVDDCETVSRIRARGWRGAYTGLVPQSYLDEMELAVAEDAERRRASLGRGTTIVNLVAERPGSGVIGWGCYGPYREMGRPVARGELYALYVTPEQIGTGAGRALMAEILGRTTAAGFPDLALWVLKENAPARRFYERAGFRPDGAEESFEADGALVPEVRYVRALGGPAAT
ncbi:GNAT family N-acetyltransferase [Streptomyces sp. NPDC053720]|uniref:GNAT family N-acetyltransferase n=1 Tax=Streptomyces sp. NPDC053720 TaxID=3154855 RepID=UPI00342A306B